MLPQTLYDPSHGPVMRWLIVLAVWAAWWHFGPGSSGRR